MGIVSVSLNDKNLEALDEIRSVFGLSGRSEAIRTAVNMAMSEIQGLENMTGAVEGVLIIVRRDHADPWMSLIQVKYESSIKTQLHSHLKDHKCLEVMIIASDAGALSSLIKEVHATGKADYVRFVRN
ncbi:MAG: ribbon-helix-helix protein, CopG family [Candidatus Methanoplasma sp.]|jgi:CopG family nickel-responsive transcriptional regulator|nr:ribbon-helix-helix protein, CopG family [Candidatus Methanoplasma sp.]